MKTVISIDVTNSVPNEARVELPGLSTQLVKVTLGNKAYDFIALDTSEIQSSALVPNVTFTNCVGRT